MGVAESTTSRNILLLEKIDGNSCILPAHEIVFLSHKLILLVSYIYNQWDVINLGFEIYLWQVEFQDN